MTEQMAVAYAQTFRRLGRDLVTRPDLIDILPIAIYACDADGRVCWFNSKAAELWGRSPAIGEDTERFCGSFRLRGLEGQLITREETPMAHVLRTGQPVHGGQARVERPDGSMVVAMVHIDPVHDDDGRLIGAINCFHDVTDLHGARASSADNGALFRQILDALPAAVYATDSEGTVSYYNKAAVDLAGREPELGDKWCVTWKIFTPQGEYLPHDQCPMAVALRENRPVRGVEAVAERPDGTRRPFLPFPTPLRDASGRLVGAVNMLVDISDRKDAETQQKRLLAELNHRVKNNLQMLHALLATAQRNTDSAEARTVLGDATQRIAAMASAQQVLYGAESATTYSAPALMQVLAETARQTFGPRLNIDFIADEGVLGNDTCMPLALIVNELLTNAAKYAVGDRPQGNVSMALIRDTVARWELRLQDDGPGFDLLSTQRRSSGLTLVQGLAGQIGGNFTVQRANGALCILRFPDGQSIH